MHFLYESRHCTFHSVYSILNIIRIWLYNLSDFQSTNSCLYNLNGVSACVEAMTRFLLIASRDQLADLVLFQRQPCDSNDVLTTCGDIIANKVLVLFSLFENDASVGFSTSLNCVTFECPGNQLRCVSLAVTCVKMSCCKLCTSTS